MQRDNAKRQHEETMQRDNAKTQCKCFLSNIKLTIISTIEDSLKKAALATANVVATMILI